MLGMQTDGVVRHNGSRYVDKEDGQYWMNAKDFERNYARVQSAVSFGVAWKKVTQTGNFENIPITATVACNITQSGDKSPG